MFSITFPIFLYRFLPARLASLFHLIFDISISSFLLIIGRVLPSLRLQLPTSPTHLSGRTAIITGSNSGIGLQIALDLTRLGATVILACRNVDKAEAAKAQILSAYPGAKDRILLYKLDTSSLASVRDFADQWHSQSSNAKKVDILIHNAGIAGIPTGAAEFSEEGFELTYATNLLGSFLLTYLLEKYLAEDARVIFTSSTGQYSGRISKDFSIKFVRRKIEPGFHVAGHPARSAQKLAGASSRYGQTKAMQCAFARALQARFERKARDAGILNRKVVHAFTPGFTATPIFGKCEVRSLVSDPAFAILKATTVLATHVSEGAATGTWLASTDDGDVVGPGQGGRYWDRCVPRMSKADLLGDETIDRLWLRWEADAGIEWR